MEQQIDTLNLYADQVAAKEQADWELRVRQAVEHNSKEYQEEQAKQQALLTLATTNNDSNETVVDKVSKYIRGTKNIPCYKPSFEQIMLVVIAVLLLLNLIIKK